MAGSRVLLRAGILPPGTVGYRHPAGTLRREPPRERDSCSWCLGFSCLVRSQLKCYT